MAYQVEESGIFEQLGEYSCTFTLTDVDGIMPEVVLAKNFKVTENLQQRINNAKIIDCLLYENQYLAGV